MRRGFDAPTLREAFKGPGQDTRAWFSIGLVDKETPDAPSVEFDPEVGPLVAVTLQPSNMPIVCRVLGQGEGEWSVFVEGDEVHVAIVDGDPKAGAVIVGRAPNGIDKMPDTIAGQDATMNAFSWKQTRPPFIWEVADAWALRSAVTGALFRLGVDGSWTMSDGDNDYIAVTPDFITAQSGDASMLIQIDILNGRATMQAGDAQLQLSKDGDAYLSAFGNLFITGNGAPPVAHAIGVEQVLVLMQAYILALGGALATEGPPIAAVGAAIAAAVTPATLNTLFEAVPTVAMALLVEPYKAALTLALQTPPDETGAKPGVGSSGVLIG